MDQLNKSARDLLDDLAEKAKWMNLSRVKSKDKPGQMIRDLSPIQRFIITNLRAEDTQQMRWPR